MSDNTIPLAVEGDEISIAALASAVDYCNRQADALDAELGAAIQAGKLPQARLNELRDLRNEHRAKALMLAAGSIRLQAGEAKISAEHVASAVGAATKTIESIQAFKDKLAKLGAVLDFFATLLTGSGRQIVAGAKTLKSALEA